MSNTPYYQAEARLSARIGNMDHDELVRRMVRFVDNADPEVNRQLFDVFDITEEEEEN